MKLYTKTGDDGSTGLYGGQRVAKDSLRIEAVGAVDELNSLVGLSATSAGDSQLAQIIRWMQSRLFDLGADLSTPHAESAQAAKIRRIDPAHIAEAERQIDSVCDHLAPLQQFILPGGGETAARLHVARTVCRRAERVCIALSRSEPIGEHVVIFLNRLSDLLFAMARRANQAAGIEDVPWQPGGG